MVLAILRDQVVIIDDRLLARLQLPRDDRAHAVHKEHSRVTPTTT